MENGGNFMNVTREMVMAAKECTGLLRKYGSEELVEIMVLPEGTNEETDVFCYDCEEYIWRQRSQDSYWDLFESSAMLTLMRAISNEDAASVLDALGAFSNEQ